MSLDDILALSEEEFNKIYLERLYKLREDIKSIRARYRKKNKHFTPNQELICQMISTAKNSAIIHVDNVRIQFETGCRKHGLKHILLRHFCDECEGRVSAMDIISLERFLKQNNSFMSSDGSKYGYTYEKNKEDKYRLILFKDTNAKGVLTVYKIDRIMLDEESGEGASSPEGKPSETSRVNLEKTK